jgi:hypothetical protein
VADPFHIAELIQEAVLDISRPLRAWLHDRERLVSLNDVSVHPALTGRWHVRFRFTDGDYWTCIVRRSPPQQYEPELRRACRSLYSRLYEDELLLRELAPRRRRVRELLEAGAHAATIAQEEHELAYFEEHLRRHHRLDAERAYRWFGADPGVDNGSSSAVTFAQANPPIGEGLTLEAMPRAMRELAVLDDWLRTDVLYGYRYMDPRACVRLEADDKTARAADAKALALLKSWLSPEQLADYERHQHFYVTGSHSRRTYRIRHGRQLNIDEMDGRVDRRRKPVFTWCFLPEGQLAAGDVMLAQKIALETDERAALKVANRFEAGPPGRSGYATMAFTPNPDLRQRAAPFFVTDWNTFTVDMRPGAVNVVEGA